MAKPSDNKVPKIRFKGYGAEWTEDKLGERVAFFSGLTYSPRNVRNAGTLVLRSSNVKDGEIVNADNVYVDPKIVNSKNVELGDIAVVVRNGSRSLIGKHAQVKKRMDNTVIGAFMTGIQSERPAFTNALLDSHQFDKEIAKNLGATINQITTGVFKKMVFHFPSPDEQSLIGEYFQELDQAIALHQQKHDKLVTLKQAMLQKLFPQPSTTTPEIRFKGFSKPWSVEKLHHFIEVSTEKNMDGAFGKEHVLSVSGDVGVVNQIEFQGRSFAGKSVQNYGVVKHRYIVYTKSPLKANPFGIIKTNLHDDGIVSTLYAIYKPKPQTDSVFVQYYFELDRRLNSYLKPLVNKGAKNDMKVSDENALLGKVIFPEKAEQQKIANYFLKLDELISKHAIQLAKFKQLKSACLERMFV